MAICKAGWDKPFNVRKWHYFVGDRSLCRKWWNFYCNPIADWDDESPDNCAACKKKLAIRKKRETKDNG